MEFALETETRWQQPGRSATFKDFLERLDDAFISMSIRSYSQVGDPSWRVVISEGGVSLPGSTWSNDWPFIEQNLARWKEQVPRLSAEAVRQEAARLAMTTL